MNDGVNLGFIVEIVQGDALKYPADVLAIKYAPRSAGVGAQVRQALQGDIDLLPGLGEYRILPGGNTTQTDYVLMVGTPPIAEMGYAQLRDLARRFLEALWEKNLATEHLLMTLHGVRTGAGLDEVEAFRSLLLGLTDAYEAGHYPPTLRRITFIEQDDNRVRVIREALGRFVPEAAEPRAPQATSPTPAPQVAPAAPNNALAPPAAISTGTAAVITGAESIDEDYRGPTADSTTPHVFVAMPFKDDYDDQYYLGIQPVVHAAGLLCERMDLDAFTGDIKVRMLERIRSARLVIALLDGANPNVYLEIGYAWGVATPTILIAHQGEPLPFDVRGERILLYDRIYRLKDMLAIELARLAEEWT